MYMYIYIYFRRNKVYASWKLDKAPMSVNRGSHFQVHFVWQVWDGQLSPAFKSIRLKAFGGWKVDWVTTQLHARILRGKGVQKKKPNKFTVGNATSATFCPTSASRHRCSIAEKEDGRFPRSSIGNRHTSQRMQHRFCGLPPGRFWCSLWRSAWLHFVRAQNSAHSWFCSCMPTCQSTACSSMHLGDLTY